MTAVVEYTLQAKPGEYAEVRDSYAAFVDGIEHTIADARLIMVVGEPDGGLVRGVGVYDSAEEVHNLPRMGFFATFTEQVTPHLEGPAERVEFTLEHIWVHEGLAPVVTDVAVLAEATWHVKADRADEFFERYVAVCEAWIADVPDTRLLVLAADRASGLVRAFVLYDHGSTAHDAPTYPLLADFIVEAAPLFSAPPERAQHHLIHLFQPAKG